MDLAQKNIFMQGIAAALAGMVDEGTVLESVNGMVNDDGEVICWRVTISAPNKPPKSLFMNAQILTLPTEIQ